MTWNYIAGFFDGEGSLVHNGKGFRILIPQTHEGVLLEIKNFIGSGIIYKVAKRKEHWKESWVYCIAKQEDILKFINKIKNNLVVKKITVLNAIPRLTITLNGMAKRKKLRIDRKNTVEKLRAKGLTYREIGKKVGIDFGYARRLLIN
ncbi:MAG: LAGLIDADG family homing endonuclease [bacterium]|nr:LAGLIDADG family homing endonuclease [bacterium]